MEKSEQINELALSLVCFQAEMQTVVYDADNPFYKSKYATLAALVSESKDLLAKNKLAVSQLIEDECSVTTILLHISGQFIQSKVSLRAVRKPMRGDDKTYIRDASGNLIMQEHPDPQAMGSAITYARRYAYAAILGLVSDKDDDGNSASGLKEEQRVDTGTLLPSMKERVIAEGKKKFKSPDEFKTWRIDHKLVEDLSIATEKELTYLWAVLREKK